MRLDNYLVENGYFDSRTKAKQAIERNEVSINGKTIKKSSFEVNQSINNDVQIICESSFVSLGGFKLEKALIDFNFDVNDMVAADVGASTGGFTDCLLQNGVKTVFAVDLNDKLLHEKLKSLNSVVPIIKNARELTTNDFSLPLDLIVADLSFISATYVLSTFSSLLSSGKHLILLIKPQFETGGKIKFKNGVIKDEKMRRAACDKIISAAAQVDFEVVDFTTAPIVNGKNVEYLILLKKK